ncbi:MAG: LPS assembly lipoprotein LptE [Pseudomonadota bacterium]
MWSSDRFTRRAVVVGSVSALACCGFEPVYAPSGTGAALRGQVAVQTPANSNGFIIRQRLEDQFGAADNARFNLSVRVTTTERRVAVTRNQATRRFNILGNATYVFTDTRTGRQRTGEVETFTSYAATGTTVATAAAERDGYRRLMVDLADRLIDQLYASVPGTAG